MIITAILIWLTAALSFYGSQKYNRSGFEAVFAILSLLLHGALAAILVTGSFKVWLALVPIALMALVVSAAVSGNESMRQQNLFSMWLELQIGFALTVLIHALLVWLSFNTTFWLNVFALSVGLAVNGILFVNLRRYQLPQIQTKPLPSKEQPTVSLLIPARNEDHALKQALTAATQSDYSKLEILVLDDCSHDKTPEIIRDFAHDGVRFIQGMPPSENWLGKNYALEQLRTAANGEILLFCDVDVRFDHRTITDIVELMRQQKLDMVSLLPRRSVFDVWPTLLRPMSDFLLAVLPFQLLDSRAVIGTSYAVRSKVLERFGGYEEVKGHIFPEFAFAQNIIKKGRYKFYFGHRFGVQTRKRLNSQEESLVRILFPALNSDVLLVYVSVLIAALVVWPYALLFIQPGLLVWLAAFAWGLAYARVIHAVHGRTALLAVVQFPVLVIHELALLFVSVYKYFFARVIWKERNICMPVLETTPHLPELD